jgi:hypothetical protein
LNSELIEPLEARILEALGIEESFLCLGFADLVIDFKLLLLLLCQTLSTIKPVGD